MYSNVVMGMNHSLLEVSLEDLKDEKSYKHDKDLKVEDLKFLVGRFKEQIADTTGMKFPVDPYEQLWGAISAVFESWESDRANTATRISMFVSTDSLTVQV